ncbi:aminomethyltransferase [Holotrichia oblita]|nr:aminomethyltransferase [Holotrichia oblita]
MGLKRTPLYEVHKALGAKLVDFGGWELPIQYTQVIGEHINTREKAGLFDVSHMGELLVTGKDAKKYLNMLITNDINLLVPKKVIYSPVPNEEGGVVDDLLVYMISDEEFLLVVNASNTDKDFAWFDSKLQELSGGSVKVENKSEHYGQLALQGLAAQQILQKLVSYNLNHIEFFFFENLEINGKKAIISRTGYTGEDGFEIYCTAKDTSEIWHEVTEAGEEYGICPVGLGARDTLRFEAGLPLYGHELSDNISPVEAGLKYFVKPNKDGFIGKAAIEEHYFGGAPRKLVGIEITSRGIPREGYRIVKNGIDVGYITSGTHSPTFKKGLGMALVSAEYAALGTELEDGKAHIGITDYAQDALGDIVFVELPKQGAVIVCGKTFGSVESVKAVSDLVAPVSGKVIEVNEALNDEPQLLNEAPYDNYVITVEMSDPGELETLMDDVEYEEFCGKEN